VIGQTVSHYRILQKIGSGGMGVVYSAEDGRLGRRVALKFLSPDMSFDPVANERLQREARAASALTHPNICTIYDIAEATPDGKQHFIVMELVDGPTLADYTASKRMQVGELLDVAIQIADALDAAHSVGVIHRDLKPANIVITPRGLVKVLDFGLAKHLDTVLETVVARQALTDPGTAIGTVAYMSPEQARGDDVDARSDLFSFGLILYELATGHRAFPGRTHAVVFDAILNRTPTPPRRTAPEIPSELERLIGRAIEKEASARVQTARDMLVELRTIKRALDSGTITAAVPASVPSIAILPFNDLSKEQDQQYFCDGVADALTTALDDLGGLRVASTAAAVRCRDKGVDIGEIGERLNVQHVLEGSALKVGTRLRITAHLVDAGARTQIWAERYDRQVDDVFEIQDDIASAIVDNLHVRLVDPGTAMHVRRPARNPEAYDRFLEGRYHWERRNLTLALACFEDATLADAGSAEAHAAVADCYVATAISGARRGSEVEPLATAAADRALALDESLPMAHRAAGAVKHWLGWDWESADRSFRRAVELHPKHAPSYAWRALLLACLRRYDEACRLAARASELDPDSAVVASMAASASFWSRRFDVALVQIARALELDANAPQAYRVRSLILTAAGRHSEAIATAERSVSTARRQPLFVSALAQAHGAAGHRAEAEALIAELETRRLSEYIAPCLIADVYTALGDNDLACEWFRMAAGDRNPLIATLGSAPMYDTLRDDPRFRTLLRKIDLPV
jgi:non-specific serine/threonine protein kinase